MIHKTLKNKAAENNTAETYPSTLKHWWKCDEATGATTLVDTINGANIDISAITSSDGIITTLPSLIDGALSATPEAIGTKDFCFMFKGVVGIVNYVDIGAQTGHSLKIAGSVIANTEVNGASGTTSVVSNTDADDASWALVRNSNDSGNIALYKNGVIVGTSDADGSGSIILEDEITLSGITTLAGMALYVYDTLPKNIGDIIRFNSANWAANNKIVWPE